MTYQSNQHFSVMFEESIGALSIRPDGVYLDATFGRGGHSGAILNQLGERGQLVAIDRDLQAIEYGKVSLEDDRLSLVHANYADVNQVLERLGLCGRLDGVLIDCGVSSPQLDDASRGFSFKQDGPLDMRMDQTMTLRAVDWINSASEEEIADVLYHNADERYSRRIAKFICESRKEQAIETTLQLAEIVKKAVVRWQKDTHPATRTFQAIRVHINDEYASLEKFLNDVLEEMKVGAFLVMLSFHSTEHLLIKRFIQRNRPGNENLKRGLQTQLVPRLRRVGRVLKPSYLEMRSNTRSRSAQLRIVEKIA